MTVPGSGLEIAYEEFGDPAGVPVLLLHGLGADMTIFPERELITPLVALGGRVVRIDHRDCGQSEHLRDAKPVGIISTALKHKLGFAPSVPYTLRDSAHDAAELLAELGIERAHVVGHSMGGMIAQLLGLQHPNLVASITSIASCPGPGAGPHTGSLMRARKLSKLDSPSGGPLYLGGQPVVDSCVAAKTRYYSAMCGTMWGEDAEGWHNAQNRERVHRMTSGYKAYLDACNRQVAAVLLAPGRAGELGAVRCPVLVVHGDLDPVIPVKNAAVLAVAVPHAQSVIVKGRAPTPLPSPSSKHETPVSPNDLSP